MNESNPGGLRPHTTTYEIPCVNRGSNNLLFRSPFVTRWVDSGSTPAREKQVGNPEIMRKNDPFRNSSDGCADDAAAGHVRQSLRTSGTNRLLMQSITYRLLFASHVIALRTFSERSSRKIQDGD